MFVIKQPTMSTYTNDEISEHLLECSRKYECATIGMTDEKKILSYKRISDSYADSSRLILMIKAEVGKMTREELLYIKGIGASTADIITSFINQKESKKMEHVKDVQVITIDDGPNEELCQFLVKTADSLFNDEKLITCNIIYNAAYRISLFPTAIESGEDVKKHIHMCGKYMVDLVNTFFRSKKESIWKSVPFLSEEALKDLERIVTVQDALLLSSLNVGDRALVYWKDHFNLERNNKTTTALSKIFETKITYSKDHYVVNIDDEFVELVLENASPYIRGTVDYKDKTIHLLQLSCIVPEVVAVMIN